MFYFLPKATKRKGQRIQMIDFSDHASALKPLQFFEEITAIPRASSNTAGIADYLMRFAIMRGLVATRDRLDNCIIKKPATRGYENHPTLIIQGHTDIVAEKLAECDIDMSIEGPKIYRDGDFIKAEGTTLGADDGVALAYALAILDSKDIPHPAIEALFTSDEEIGLVGAGGLDTTKLSGRIMINIDSDTEGIFTVGCAGGVRADLTLPLCREPFGTHTYKMTVSGLLGGHSGTEIDKGRVNAIKIIAELLSRISERYRIVTLEGGCADNAIPRESSVVFSTEEELSELSRSEIELLSKDVKKSESDFLLTIEKSSIDSLPLDTPSSTGLLSLILREPSGVIKMSEDIQGLVETSLNMGIASTENDSFSLSFSLRSSKGEEKKRLLLSVTEIAEEHGASAKTRGDYPAWEYKKDSMLCEKAVKVYQKMYQKDPTVTVIHAGLECGIFSDKMEGLDCISLGPDNFDIHTPEEKLSISSFARVWEFLKELIKTI